MLPNMWLGFVYSITARRAKNRPPDRNTFRDPDFYGQDAKSGRGPARLAVISRGPDSVTAPPPDTGCASWASGCTTCSITPGFSIRRAFEICGCLDFFLKTPNGCSIFSVSGRRAWVVLSWQAIMIYKTPGHEILQGCIVSKRACFARLSALVRHAQRPETENMELSNP